MSVTTSVVLILVAFGLGFFCCGLLTIGLVEDLRNLLAGLFENPNDALIRDLVAETLYQKDAK